MDLQGYPYVWLIVTFIVGFFAVRMLAGPVLPCRTCRTFKGGHMSRDLNHAIEYSRKWIEVINKSFVPQEEGKWIIEESTI
jgi:hypothetical protein